MKSAFLNCHNGVTQSEDLICFVWSPIRMKFCFLEYTVDD